MANFWKINEDGKSELHFDFESFKALGEADKKEIKAYYLWSGGKSAWISKAKDDWRTKKIADRLNIPFEGKNKKLSFQEELEKKESKAEGRADKYEAKAIKAEKKAERLQSEFNRLRQDWSWLTQPIIKGHAGSERFGRSKQRVLDSYSKGFEEYDRAEYFKRKKELAEKTKSKPELRDLNYVQNRIKESEKAIRALEKWITEYTEKMESYKNDESKIATVGKYESAIEEGLQKLQYNYDKLAYYKLAYDEIMSHNKGGDIAVFDKSLSIDLGKYIKKYFKEKYSLSVSIATSAHYVSVICRPSVPKEVRKSVALFIYPNERERIESWGDNFSIGNIRETYVTLHPREWYEWLKIQGWDFGKKDFTQDIAEKYDITESEAKTAIEIESEHIDTLQKVYDHELTPQEAVLSTIEDHVKEHKDYYDKDKGLPNMEKELDLNKTISTDKINSELKEYSSSIYFYIQAQNFKEYNIFSDGKTFFFETKSKGEHKFHQSALSTSSTVGIIETIFSELKYVFGDMINRNGINVCGFRKRANNNWVSTYYNIEISKQKDHIDYILDNDVVIKSDEYDNDDLTELFIRADAQNKTITAEVEDNDIEYYKSLGFVIKE